jgi:hypothetical protein
MAEQYLLSKMLDDFGVVEVMDAAFYPTKYITDPNDTRITAGTYKVGDWDAVKTFHGVTVDEAGNETLGTDLISPVVTLDTLKVVNLNTDGPSKTIKGGIGDNTLIKYGKTYTIEATDALGHYNALEQLYGAKGATKNAQILSVTDKFPIEYTLVGTTYVVNKENGAKQPIKIVIPCFLGDGIFNLALDAEGDASTFDLKGNINKFYDRNDADTIVDHKYAGTAGEYYFMCTDKALDSIEKFGYAETLAMTDDAIQGAGA